MDTKTVKFRVIGPDPGYMIFNQERVRGEIIEFSLEEHIMDARKSSVLEELSGKEAEELGTTKKRRKS